jgi:hypothetical protein
VELSAGSVLRLDGTEWAVAAIEAQYGRVLLKAGGDERWRTIRWLAHHPDCQPVPDGDTERPRPSGSRRPCRARRAYSFDQRSFATPPGPGRRLEVSTCPEPGL